MTAFDKFVLFLLLWVAIVLPVVLRVSEVIQDHLNAGQRHGQRTVRLCLPEERATRRGHL